jgi:hypothetical protein
MDTMGGAGVAGSALSSVQFVLRALERTALLNVGC